MKRQNTKLFIICITILLCSISLTMTCFAADNLGKIKVMKDYIEPDGENGKIRCEIIAVTDIDGKLAFPSYEDALLKAIDVTQGTLKEEVTKVEKGTITYYEASFEEKEAEVKINVEWYQEETYKLGKAKTKDTAPGGLKAIKYTMQNTAPITISSYEVDMGVPKDYEVFSIVDYDPEEPYEIYTNEGYKVVYHSFGEIESGSQAKLTVNITETKGSFTIVIWLLVILISIFFLYKNRDMLKEAKELANKKEQEKKEASNK